MMLTEVSITHRDISIRRLMNNEYRWPYLKAIKHQANKTTIHQVTTMLATSKNVLFPGHNHLLTTGTDDPTLWLSASYMIIKVMGHQYWSLAGGYDLEIGLLRSGYHGGYLVDSGFFAQWKAHVVGSYLIQQPNHYGPRTWGGQWDFNNGGIL